VLLVAGEHAMFVPLDLLTQLAALVPTAQVLKADGAGHAVHNARPEWFAGVVLDWLKKN
jgi:pimeloyl-ACP methyl ester carboxylesterase